MKTKKKSKVKNKLQSYRNIKNAADYVDDDINFTYTAKIKSKPDLDDE